MESSSFTLDTDTELSFLSCLPLYNTPFLEQSFVPLNVQQELGNTTWSSSDHSTFDVAEVKNIQRVSLRSSIAIKVPLREDISPTKTAWSLLKRGGIVTDSVAITDIIDAEEALATTGSPKIMMVGSPIRSASCLPILSTPSLEEDRGRKGHDERRERKWMTQSKLFPFYQSLSPILQSSSSSRSEDFIEKEENNEKEEWTCTLAQAVDPSSSTLSHLNWTTDDRPHSYSLLQLPFSCSFFLYTNLSSTTLLLLVASSSSSLQQQPVSTTTSTPAKPICFLYGLALHHFCSPCTSSRISSEVKRIF